MEPLQTTKTPKKLALARYLKYTKRFTETTQRHYQGALRRFLPYMPEYIEDLRAEHIDIWISTLKICNNSKNSNMIPIRSFLSWCETYLAIPSVAKKVDLLPEQPHRQRVITGKEYDKLLKVCKSKECDVIKILANTGLRSSEFGSLNWQNISPDETYLTVIGKGRRRRVVPINNTTRRALHHLNFSKSYNRKSLYYMCRCLAEKAEIPKFGPHALRHFFCTRLIKKGVPISMVGRILGHSDISTTIRTYTHILPSDTLGITDILDEGR